MNAVGYKYANNISQKDSSQLGNWNYLGIFKPLATSTECYNSPKQAKKQFPVTNSTTQGGDYEDYLKFRF